MEQSNKQKNGTPIMYKVTYTHYGTQHTDVIEATSYTHAESIAQKAYAEMLNSITKL